MNPGWFVELAPLYIQVAVMEGALRAKLQGHPGPRALLLASACQAGSADLIGINPESSRSSDVIEDSPTDAVWGCGRDGTGGNLLGSLMMKLRDELAAERGDEDDCPFA